MFLVNLIMVPIVLILKFVQWVILNIAVIICMAYYLLRYGINDASTMADNKLKQIRKRKYNG